MKKELRRDPNNKIIAGVCSGIAKYLDIDPVIIRLIWAAAIFLPYCKMKCNTKDMFI